MANLGSQHPFARPAFVATRSALFVLSMLVAVTAGCGGSGSKPASETAGGTATTPEPAAAAPAVSDSVTPPVADGSSAPAGDLGAKVFATRCALCHGPNGHGDGVASKGLNPKPRNFHDLAYMQTRTDAQLLEVIHKGKGAMPKWEGQLSEAEIAAVLAHVRSLGK